MTQENHPQVNLRAASDFAHQLNVHVNHLNRAVKETTGKTTSQIIAERILQEAKILLKHSKWLTAISKNLIQYLPASAGLHRLLSIFCFAHIFVAYVLI